jgi:hypothetical protein
MLFAPELHAQRQSRMKKQPLSFIVADTSKPLRSMMRAVVQRGRVFNQEVFAGGAAE